jgi:hypothetical protein
MAACLPARAAAAPDFSLPAVQLRVQLGHALGEHALLVIEAMRRGIIGGEQFEVVAGSVEENTGEIVAAIEQVYGAAAADEFGEHWRSHIAYLVDYTRAIAEDDADAQALAAQQLDEYVEHFSHFLSSANPLLPNDVITELIDEHRAQLSQIASFAEGEFGTGYEALRETYRHMYEIGDGLALAIIGQFPERFPGRDTAFSPAVDVRMTLERLLGEHMYLAAAAMRARLEGAEDLPAIVEAVGANSAELAGVIGEIYGDPAAAAFDDLWSSHVDHYLAYVDAIAADDASAADAALEALRTYRAEFGEFLTGANPYLDPVAFEAMLARHTDHLTEQVIAYRDEGYEEAYAIGRHGYAQTSELAAGLSGAIADQFPLLFPDTALLGAGGEANASASARALHVTAWRAPTPT